MYTVLHDEDLVDDEFLPRLRSEVHLLDGDLVAVLEVFCDVDRPAGTLPNFFDLRVQLARVRGRDDTPQLLRDLRLGHCRDAAFPSPLAAS